MPSEWGLGALLGHIHDFRRPIQRLVEVDRGSCADGSCSRHGSCKVHDGIHDPHRALPIYKRSGAFPHLIQAQWFLHEIMYGRETLLCGKFFEPSQVYGHSGRIKQCAVAQLIFRKAHNQSRKPDTAALPAGRTARTQRQLGL